MSEAPKKIWASDMGGWFETENSHDTPYIRADLVHELVDELRRSLYVFRVYQAHHEAKGDRTKAEANGAYAKAIEAALKALEEE